MCLNFIHNFKGGKCFEFVERKINVPITEWNNSDVNFKVTAILLDKGISKWTIDLLIFPKTTEVTTTKQMNISKLNIPRNVELAYPKFFIPQNIDL